MSYSGFKYSPYQYGPGIGDQNTQYLSSRAPSTSSTPSLQKSMRGYGASSYDWQAQNSQGMPIEDNQQLGNNRWRLPYAQDEYSYQDSLSRRSGSSAQTSNSVSFLSTPSPLQPQPRAPLETPALNSLAYASGLELAGLKKKAQRSKTPKPTESITQTAVQSQSRMRSPAGMAQSYPSTSMSSTAAAMSQASQQRLAASAVAALSPEATLRSYTSTQMPPSSASYSHPTTYASSLDLVSSGDHLSTANEHSVSQSSTKNLRQDVWNQRDSQDQRHQYSSASHLPSVMESTGYNPTQESSTASLTLPDVNSIMGISKPTDRQSISASTALPVSSPQTPRSAMQLPQGESPGQYAGVSHNMYSSSISTPSLTGTTWDDTRFARQPSPTNNLPGYIDPTQVYNPYRQEYERMKAAEAEAEAEAEAQKQAEKEQEAANQASAQTQDTTMHDHSNHGGTEQDNTHNASHSHSYPVPPTPEKKKRGRAPRKSPATGANASGSNASTKKSQVDATEQNIDPLLRSVPQTSSAPQTDSAQTDGNDDSGEIDMTMKMIQEWRSKDPARFAKLMDVLKKDPAPKGTAIETPSQNGDGEATASTALAASTTTPSATTPDKPSTKSRGSNTHLIDGLPDLSRFPAQRRRRYNKHKGNGSTGDATASSQSPIPSMTAVSFGNTSAQPAEPTRPDSSSASMPPDAPSAAGNNAHNETPTPSVVANDAHNDTQTATPATGNTQNGAPSTADGPSTASNKAPTSAPSEAGNKALEEPNTEQVTKQTSEQLKGQPQKPGMTVWSEPKRQAVAKATSQYLVAIPANRDKTGSVEMILSLIDNNPSYIELCEQIEARGYVINRSSLAKHLLATVPDLNSSNAPQPPQHKPDPNSRVISQPPPGPINRVQPQQSVQGQPQIVVWKNPPVAHLSRMPAPPATTGSVAAPAPAPGPVPGPPPGPVPAPGPQTVPGPGPRPASGHPPAPGPGPLHGPPPPPPACFSAPPPLQPRPSPVSLPLHRPPPPSGRPGAKRSRPSAPPPPAPPPDSKAARARKHLFSEIVDLSALSDDEDADRAAKEPRLEGPSQEPQADISVAKAQQPQNDVPQQPQTDLPQIAVPQTAAPQSNAESTSSRMNLSRFAFSPDEASRKEALRLHSDIVKPLNKAEALRRNFYNPKTIARDVLIAAGRHPTERPLNHHLLRLRDIFLQVDYTSDMETFRWDLVDPGGPPMPVVEPEDVALLPPTYPLGTRKKGPRGAESREMRDAADGASSDGPKSNVTAVAPHEHKSSNLSISRSFDDDTSLATPPTRPEKKRDEQRDEKHVTPMARPASSTPSSSVPSTRRRGRPPGAKNKLPTKAALRAAGASGPKIEVAIPVPSPPRTFSVYRCDWENCQAELHDLSTLERHVSKIHAPGSGGSSGDHACRWLGCSRSQKRFSSSAELRRHLQADHVGPIAWKLGDGPSVRPTVIESERYLNDSSGSVITPDASLSSATIQPDHDHHTMDHDDIDIDSDSLIFPAGYTPIRAYNRVHGNHSNPEKARAVLKAVERMKVRIGPGLEQGGCEIANPVRMSRVGNDEGVMRLVGSQG